MNAKIVYDWLTERFSVRSSTLVYLLKLIEGGTFERNFDRCGDQYIQMNEDDISFYDTKAYGYNIYVKAKRLKREHFGFIEWHIVQHAIRKVDKQITRDIEIAAKRQMDERLKSIHDYLAGAHKLRQMNKDKK